MDRAQPSDSPGGAAGAHRFALVRGGPPEGELARVEERLRELQARHAAVLDAAFDAIVTMDRDGHCVDFNRAAEQMFGYARADAIGRPVAELIVPPDLREAHRRGLRRVGETGMSSMLGRAVSLRAMRATGETFDAELTVNRVELSDGPMFTASIRDLSEQNAVERELRTAEERYRNLVEHLPLIVYVDEAGEGSPNVYTSPQTTQILGYTPEDWREDPQLLAKILHPDDRKRILDEVRLETERDRTSRSEYRLITRDGRTVWVRDESTAICDPNGRPLQWQGYLLDVTAEREAAAELEQLAFTDQLTGLPNRSSFERAAAERGQTGRPVTLLYLDLDDFKTVNDSLGHGVGDQLLASVARRLEAIVRPDDLVARIGGDEFALLLGDCDTASVAQRIVSALRRPFDVAGNPLSVSASIGVAIETDPAEMLRHADVAMYEAKAAGGGTYRFFEQSMQETAVKRLQLLADLDRPTLADELFLEYQPIFRLESGELIACEALTRWRHPKRGLIPPRDFIGLAEETGKIAVIGRQVLETACAHAATWIRAHGPLRISVNVAARQLADPTFAGAVSTILASTGLDPRRLTLELTESVLMTGDQVAERNVNDLRALGLRIAIDDFGTGYSSLAYLAKLSIDTIKIDRSFVDACDRSVEGARIVEAITTLGHALNIAVVAEGIERSSQLDVLRTVGCDAVQGFLLGGPVPAEQIDARLAEQTPALRMTEWSTSASSL